MVSGLISIGIFLVAQLIISIWWAATMNTKMDFLVTSTKDTKHSLETHIMNDLATFSTKKEVEMSLTSHEKQVAVALAIADKEVSAIWKQIDILKSNLK
jgi:archaellum component FlaG (FlaF/FlaG flagellin family)